MILQQRDTGLVQFVTIFSTDIDLILYLGSDYSDWIKSRPIEFCLSFYQHLLQFVLMILNSSAKLQLFGHL